MEGLQNTVQPQGREAEVERVTAILLQATRGEIRKMAELFVRTTNCLGAWRLPTQGAAARRSRRQTELHPAARLRNASADCGVGVWHSVTTG